MPFTQDFRGLDVRRVSARTDRIRTVRGQPWTLGTDSPVATKGAGGVRFANWWRRTCHGPVGRHRRRHRVPRPQPYRGRDHRPHPRHRPTGRAVTRLLLAGELALLAVTPNGTQALGSRDALNACLAGLLLAELRLPDQPQDSPALSAVAAIARDRGPRIRPILSRDGPPTRPPHRTRHLAARHRRIGQPRTGRARQPCAAAPRSRPRSGLGRPAHSDRARLHRPRRTRHGRRVPTAYRTSGDPTDRPPPQRHPDRARAQRGPQGARRTPSRSRRRVRWPRRRQQLPPTCAAAARIARIGSECLPASSPLAGPSTERSTWADAA
jgi:hypothetical protein